MHNSHIIAFFITILSVVSIFGQQDFSNTWDDYYAYNHVLDFVETDSKIIALTDNAVFIYDKTTQETQKISSVNGLSGETTSALYYDEGQDKIVIGYETGLVEVIDHDRKVWIKQDIVNFGVIGSKRINHILGTPEGVLYLSLPFGIVGFDLNQLNFGDTYYIGNNSSEIYVSETAISNDMLYAATKNGLFVADLNQPFLIDSQNWTQYFFQEYNQIAVYENEILLGQNNQVFTLNNDFTLTYLAQMPNDIRDIKTFETYLTLTSEKDVKIFQSGINQIGHTQAQTSDAFDYIAQTARYNGQQLLIGTENFGILQSTLNPIEDFTEIHPQGPLLNTPFSISVMDDQLWVVYGARTIAYNVNGFKLGISHFNSTDWVNIPYDEDAGVSMTDLIHVNIDPSHDNRVFVSSWGQGMLVIEDDVVTTAWTHQNSGLETIVLPNDPAFVSIRIGSSVFDRMGNLWVANAWVANRLKKYANGQWTSYDLTSIIEESNGYGLNEMIIDQSGNKWIGTRDQGALVINENGTKMKHFVSNPNEGELPSLNVRALAVDKDNKVWIGTKFGLRVFNSSTSFFDQDSYTANPIVIAYGQDDNFGEALMGTQNINAICVDGADNKWFGTDSGGVLCTNPSGQETLYQFDKNNSPLPSNRILSIRFDALTGKIYFCTDKGIVSFSSNIAAYGDHLQEVYAYPNPVNKQHDFVIIDGRNGTHLPNGTNVKILDASGALVFETNVKEGQEAYGGKVVWNKRNLAGTKVASGIYIVLLSYENGQETASTKIAIIN